jgi:hypothetical protein
MVNRRQGKLDPREQEQTAQHRVRDRFEHRVAALAEADSEHDEDQSDQHGRGRRPPAEPEMPGDPTGTVAHQIASERRGQQVAQAGRDRKVALIDRVLLPWE